ncbi:MAG: type II secretion system protein [Stenotrophomonas nitritireducens]|uniref:PulJ/GspJ family protein n=1 Tax=Stenotrophomonas nitritireducens TaxID=83617 RepID=UPI001AC045FF|nr:type II secretion system protein [Stenotrophomonas nitritireducens]MBN8793579.1 type II secretion system protein [Stenotrophomonas nitritireducens]MBN8797150.1 type II secretion system protein [Stenotrophomonas nitritireducens]
MSPVARPRGFTLLEVIVTLVIVSLLITVLMQMLSHALGVRTRLLHYQERARVAFLQESWFRDTVASAQLDDSDGNPALRGSVDAFEYVASTPLIARGMGRVRWFLKADEKGEVSLHYTDAQTPDRQIVPGPLQDAEFSYLDREQQWQGVWVSDPLYQTLQPERPGMPEPKLLPRVIRFQATTPNGRIYWLVSLSADMALPKMSDLGIMQDGDGL